MGFPVSHIVANLYMKEFEKKGTQYHLHLSRLWMRNVDDTFVIQREDQKQSILDHINNIDSAIKLTVEGYQENGVISFLDTLARPEADSSLSITAYRKPMHTDQYLQWDSHYNLPAKYSVVSTFTHRAKVVCNGPEFPTKELQYLRRALTKCKYPKWALDKVEWKIFNSWGDSNTQGKNPEKGTSIPSSKTRGRDHNKEKHSKGHIVIPYTQGLGESIKKTCNKYDIQTHFKGNMTIKRS